MLLSCGHKKQKTDYCKTCYRKKKKREDPIFYLKSKHRDMRKRCRQINGDAYKRYGNFKLCSKDEFLDKFKNDEKYLRLYKEWQESGFLRKLAPSIDRIDNLKGYTLDNMQMITFIDNSMKEKCHKVEATNNEWNVSNEYKSIRECSRMMSVSYSILRRIIDTEESYAGWLFKRI